MILVIDKDPKLRNYLVELTEHQLDEGAISAASLSTAWELLAQHSFHLVLIKPDMPDGDGFDFISTLRESFSPLQLPIISVTGHTHPDLVVRSFAVGATESITLPFVPDIALARIRNQLAIHREFRQLTQISDSPPTASGVLNFPASRKAGAAGQASDRSDHTNLHQQQGPELAKTTDPSWFEATIVAKNRDDLMEMPAGGGASGFAQPSIEFSPRSDSSHADPQFDFPVPDNSVTVGNFSLGSTGDTGPVSDDQELAIPCEVPVSLVINDCSFFCKTLWINQRDLLLLAFQDLPPESPECVKMIHQGEEFILKVTESGRHALDKGAGVLKIYLKITEAPEIFDDFYYLLRNAFQENGLNGLQNLFRAMEKLVPNVPDRETTATLRFGSGGFSLKVVSGVRYQFIHQLGKGGFASVYLVNDLALKRRVAMKVLSEKFSKDPDARANFLCEAQIAAQFHHPNIVFVYEVGEVIHQDYSRFLDFPEEVLSQHPKRFIYFTMQYVKGPTLTEWLTKEPNQTADAQLDVLIGITKAMSFAHRKGVIHRDIKPDNIIISKETGVVVTDFGIANLAAWAEDATDVDISKSDHSKGISCTPPYASPEQLYGKDADGRSDIYSFGTLAYELLTGARPYQGKNLKALVRAKVKGETIDVAPLQKTSPVLSAIVLKCLATKAEDRYESADALLLELSELKGSNTGPHASTMETLNELISQAIMTNNPSQSLPILKKLVAFLKLQKTNKNAEQINMVTAKLADPALINILIDKSLNGPDQQPLITFFMELGSSAVVLEILTWFRNEKVPWRKELLAELAVISAGQDLFSLAVFGLELPDGEASILLSAFGEMATQIKEPVFHKWSQHSGLRTQRELLKILGSNPRPRHETLKILEFYAYGNGTFHQEIKSQAKQMLKKGAVSIK